MKNDMIIFGDLHITGNSIIDQPIIDTIEKESKPYKKIIFAGDVFDKFDISAKDNLFYNWLSKTKKQVIIVTGNHSFSQGRCGLYIAHTFSNKVKVIKSYEYIDYDSVRIHCLNYFRYKGKLNFELSEDKTNILISHCDLMVNKPIKEFKQFDYVINGHIHDKIWNSDKTIINIGAIRQCNTIESEDKQYITLNTTDFKELNFHELKSPVSYKKVFENQIEDLIIDRNTVLKLMLKPLDSFEDILKKIKKQTWYDENKIIVKEEKYIADTSVKEFIEDIETEFVDIKSLSKKYFEYYKEKFKIKESFKDYEDKFNDLFSKYSSEDNDFFNNYNINFVSIKSNNFKLYKKFSYKFNNFKGLTAINGFNYDEVDESGEITSNEAGKSCIREMIEYALTGDDKPLRYGEKKGDVELVLKINQDTIKIVRFFTSTKSDFHIEVNDEELWKDETNSNKIKMFYNKYKIENALQFIMITDTGKIRFFFSSRSSERVKIFKEMFPIITFMSSFIDHIKEEVKSKKSDVDKIDNELENLITNRNTIGQSLFNRFIQVDNSIKDINLKELDGKIEILKNEINQKLIANKDKYSLIKNLWNDDLVEVLSLYDKKHKQGIEDYFKVKENLKNYELAKQKLNNIDNQIKENQKEIRDINKQISQKYNELDNIDQTLNEDDIIKIKKYLIIDKLVNTLKWDKNHFDIYLEDYNTEKQELNNVISIEKNNIENYRSQYKELKDNITNLQNSISLGVCPTCKTKLDNTKEIEKQVDEIRIEMENIQKKGTDIKNVLEKNTILLSKIQNFIEIQNNIKNKLQEYNILHNDFLKYINNEMEIDIHKWNIEKIQKVEQELQKVKTLENEIKIITDNTLSSLKIKENSLQEDKKIITENMNKYQKNNQYEDYIDNLKESLNKINVNIEKYYNLLDAINKIYETDLYGVLDKNTIIDVDNKLNIIQDMEVKYDNCQKLIYQHQNMKDNLKSLTQEKENIIKEIKTKQKKYSKEKIISKKKEIDHEYDLIKNLKDILCQKKSITFEKFFISIFYDKVKEIFNTMLKIVFSRNIKLKIDENDFVFTDGNNNEMTFQKSFSNGAKTKLESIMIFTNNLLFNQFGTNSNILFIDEFLDKGLDNVNLNRVLSLIKVFFKDKNTFVISHKSIEENVDRTISVIRKNSESKVEV
jgi:DNA repair exonuclease SbcCD ATPase subunit